jgi:hypothetical protein
LSSPTVVYIGDSDYEDDPEIAELATKYGGYNRIPPDLPSMPLISECRASTYYLVTKGWPPSPSSKGYGVFEWSQAGPRVLHISGALYKSYKTLEEAYAAYYSARRDGLLEELPNMSSPRKNKV